MVLGYLFWVIQLELVTLLQLVDHAWTGELDRIISRGPFQTQPVILGCILRGSHDPPHPWVHWMGKRHSRMCTRNLCSLQLLPQGSTSVSAQVCWETCGPSADLFPTLICCEGVSVVLSNSLLSFGLDGFKGSTVYGGCHLYCTARGAALQCHLRCSWQGLGLFTLSLVSSPLKHPSLYASIFASSFSSLTLPCTVLWSITRINLLGRNFSSSAFRKLAFFFWGRDLVSI